MVDRKVDWRYLGIALVLTVLIFSVIFHTGQQINDYKVDALEDRISQIEENQRSIAVNYRLTQELDDQQCRGLEELRSDTVSEIRELRAEVEAYENSERIENDRYEQVKKDYMGAVIQNMLDLNRLEEKCDRDYLNIIYFYSNEECDACDDQGTVLTFFREEYSDNVRVHPLDTDLNMGAVNYLEEHYNVTHYPSIVVEGELYEGFQSMEQLEQLRLEKTSNQTTNDLNQTFDELGPNESEEINRTQR